MEVKLAPPQRRQERATAVGHEPVIVVHGTFANPVPRASADPYWWEPGGSFCRNLDAALERLGSPARCWAGLANSGFNWTDDNLEVARRAAARELAQYLKKIEQDPAIQRYHLVAHSHGGNVVHIALRSSPNWPKLGGLVYLGTPFLHFRAEPDRAGTAARINWFYVGTALLVGGGAWLAGSWFWGIVAVALLKPIADYYKARQQSGSFNRAGVLLRFANDEAVELLRIASPLVADSAYRRRIAKSLAPQGSPHRYNAADYIPWISEQALDGWRRLEAWKSGSIFEGLASLLTLFPALLFGALTLIARPIFFVLDKLRSVGLRFAMNRGMRAAGSLVYGINVRGLRFLPKETSEAPFPVFDYPIPPAAQQQVAERLQFRDPAIFEVRAALADATLDSLVVRLRDLYQGGSHARSILRPSRNGGCLRACRAGIARGVVTAESAEAATGLAAHVLDTRQPDPGATLPY